MSFPRYPRYKDSCVEWLGEVPAGWEVTRLKRVISSVESGTSVNAVDAPAMDGQPGVLKTSCVYAGVFDAAENKAVVCEEIDRVSCPVRSGTLIVSRMNTPDLIGAAGVVDHAPRDLYLPDRLWQVAFSGASAAFVHFWTLTPDYRAQVEAACTGTSASMKNLSQEQFGDFFVVLPPREEQSRIVAFLAHETAKVDTLIAEQRRLIELLKEKRQAVISDAVTKGLNPDTPMKSSGVEWPDRVPATWSVKRLKYLVTKRDGIQMGPFGGMLLDLDDLPTGFKVYGQENTISGDFSAGRRWISSERFRELATYEIRTGDLVVTRKGSLGNARLIESLPFPGIADSDTIRLRADDDLIGAEFLELILHSAQYIAEQIAITRRGAILAGLNSETIANLVMIVPPRDQQDRVMAALSIRLGELGTQIELSERAISLLRERRTALISAAVTGKIDVRGLAA